MDRQTIVRAWRDPIFRQGLAIETLLDLPNHPAGDSAEDDSISCVMPGITLGGGCGTAGCTKVVCTDPCTKTNVVQCHNTSDLSTCTKSGPTCFRTRETAGARHSYK